MIFLQLNLYFIFTEGTGKKIISFVPHILHSSTLINYSMSLILTTLMWDVMAHCQLTKLQPRISRVRIRHIVNVRWDSTWKDLAPPMSDSGEKCSSSVEGRREEVIL
jgi:hypothetical protein